MITIQAMIKNGGIERTQIPLKMLTGLAKGIKENGSETIHLASGKSWEVAGFIVASKEIGERVIMLGIRSDEDDN